MMAQPVDQIQYDLLELSISNSPKNIIYRAVFEGNEKALN